MPESRIRADYQDYVGAPGNNQRNHGNQRKSAVQTPTPMRSYDALNQLAGVLDWLGRTTAYTYYPDGRLASSYRLAAGETQPARFVVKSSYAYDPRGQVDTITHAVQSDPLSSFAYQYDPNGNRVMGKEILAYSRFFTPLVMMNNPGSLAVPQPVPTATPGSAPRRSLATPTPGAYPAPAARSAPNLAPTPAAYPAPVAQKNLWQQAWDFVFGAPSQAANASQPAGQSQEGAIVPIVYRPANVARLADLVAPTHAYTYDPLGRLTAANYPGGKFFSYTYDATGNRLTETTPSGTTTYTYDNANRLATVNGVSYTWDNNGNLLSDGVATYAYDHANRLKSLTRGGATTTYTYNGLGDRITQTVGGVTTRYTLDLNAGLTQVLADGTNTYLYGNGRIAQDTGTIPTYFLTDAMGSVRQLTGASGSVILTQSYKPFGEVLSSTGSGASIYGFDGEQTDPSGLQYLRARYYAPGVGRFISRDSWGGDEKAPMSYNSWLFVYANPIMNVDPSGRIPMDCGDSDEDCRLDRPDPANTQTYLREYTDRYSEKVPPPGISFTGKNLDPVKINTYLNRKPEDHSKVNAAQI